MCKEVPFYRLFFAKTFWMSGRRFPLSARSILFGNSQQQFSITQERVQWIHACRLWIPVWGILCSCEFMGFWELYQHTMDFGQVSCSSFWPGMKSITPPILPPVLITFFSCATFEFGLVCWQPGVQNNSDLAPSLKWDSWLIVQQMQFIASNLQPWCEFSQAELNHNERKRMRLLGKRLMRILCENSTPNDNDLKTIANTTSILCCQPWFCRSRPVFVPLFCSEKCDANMGTSTTCVWFILLRPGNYELAAAQETLSSPKALHVLAACFGGGVLCVRDSFKEPEKQVKRWHVDTLVLSFSYPSYRTADPARRLVQGKDIAQSGPVSLVLFFFCEEPKSDEEEWTISCTKADYLSTPLSGLFLSRLHYYFVRESNLQNDMVGWHLGQVDFLNNWSRNDFVRSWWATKAWNVSSWPFVLEMFGLSLHPSLGVGLSLASVPQQMHHTASGCLSVCPSSRTLLCFSPLQTKVENDRCGPHIYMQLVEYLAIISTHPTTKCTSKLPLAISRCYLPLSLWGGRGNRQ